MKFKYLLIARAEVRFEKLILKKFLEIYVIEKFNTVKSTILLDATPYPVEVCRRFGGIYCLHLQCGRVIQERNCEPAESNVFWSTEAAIH
jgi:hypothetical protein